MTKGLNDKKLIMKRDRYRDLSCDTSLKDDMKKLVMWCYEKAVLRIRIRDPGSVPFWPLDPGSGIPSPYYWGLSDNFLGKNFNNSWKIGPNFFLQHIKNKIILSFVATKYGLTTKFFSPLSFVAVFGSGIRDPGSGMGKNQDPGSGINIPDPPHCEKERIMEVWNNLAWSQ
jgi:hypothetical protein